MTLTEPGAPTLVGTSWKMNKTLAEAVAYVDELVDAGVPSSVEAFILPPHTALSAVRDRLPQGSRVRIGAQNAHWAAEGAGTGEISMRMARDAGATLVEIGHSERRTQFGESDEDVARKVAAALDHDLTPLVCVGEPRVVREAGDAENHVAAQVRAALAHVGGADPTSVLFAYEPVWAIGEAGTAASPAQVAPVVGAVRRAMTECLVGASTGATVRVLYGGSVDESNAVTLLEGSTADGLFIGRAAWTGAGFARLLALCGDHAARHGPPGPASQRPGDSRPTPQPARS
ncbi:MAG: Triose-phosphate isomerase [Marmoricola sp.]|nr:Triose-phosphate isomerase [Marmoricola sp.]